MGTRRFEDEMAAASQLASFLLLMTQKKLVVTTPTHLSGGMKYSWVRIY